MSKSKAILTFLYKKVAEKNHILQNGYAIARKDERSTFEVLSGAPPAQKAQRTLFMGKDAILERKSLAVSCGGITFAPSIATAVRNNMIMT